MATPAMVQMVSSTTNLLGIQGDLGNNYKFTLPNPTGAGNCIQLNMSYPTAVAAPTVTDNIGNTWPTTAAVSVDGGGTVSEIRVLKNTASGAQTFTVAFAARNDTFQYVIIEWCNVDTASPVDGTSSTGNVTGASLAAGSFTPTTNNDSNGGHLISAYFALNAASAS